MICAGERFLDQLRLALEVLIVLGIHDQGRSHDLVGDAVEGVIPDLAKQVGEGVGAEDPHPVADHGVARVRRQATATARAMTTY